MPFLLPLVPALAAGAVSAGAGAAVNGLIGSGGQKGSGFQAQGANLAAPVQTDQAQAATNQAQGGISQQQSFLNALQAQNGIQNQSNVYNQLQNVASGQGPNPAQAMLANSTGANVANQAALMAGQRGAGANVGLMARQAAQQGGALQQNAAGQAAALQAQQSLGALNQLGGIAGQQVGQQAGALQNYNALTQAQQQAMLGQINAQNTQAIQNASQQNTPNAGLAEVNARSQNNALGGIASGLGTALGSTVGAGINNAITPAAKTPPALPKLATGGQVGMQANLKENYKGKSKMGHMLYSSGGKVQAMVSPGEIYLDPSEAKKVAEGKMSPMQGERIPGKAKVKGDSQKNDTVEKKLDVGGVVVKRSKANNEESAKKFVDAIQSKKGKK